MQDTKKNITAPNGGLDVIRAHNDLADQFEWYKENMIKGRMASTAYAVDDIVIAPFLKCAVMRCVTAGTTSADMLPSVELNTNVTDGTCVWTVYSVLGYGLSQSGITGAVAVNKEVLDADIGVPAGCVFPFAGAGVVPAGYLYCNGEAKSRETYARLFSAIGTTYGAGDGSTTFNLPDFRGSFLRGNGGVAGAIGTKQAEGLPNITSSNFEVVDWFVSSSFTGAIVKQEMGLFQTGGGSSRSTKVNIDAAHSNEIYGASNHVTPENYAVQYIIRY